MSGTYTGDGCSGQDTIEACIQLIGVQQLPCATATKDWVQPTPTPTPTPSATPTPTPTPPQAPAAELPATGAQPPAGSGFPGLLAGIVGLGALAVGAGGVLLRRRVN